MTSDSKTVRERIGTATRKPHALQCPCDTCYRWYKALPKRIEAALLDAYQAANPKVSSYNSMVDAFLAALEADDEQ